MRSFRFLIPALALVAVVGLAIYNLPVRGQPGTPVSLIVWGGTVVTMRSRRNTRRRSAWTCVARSSCRA